MALIPKDLHYTSDHEWVRIIGAHATIGITDHAQDQLGDIVFVGDVPNAGASFDKGDVICVVESVKATSDIFAPLSGVVVEVNAELAEAPEQINGEPYGQGWILKIELSDSNEIDDLLDPRSYDDLVDD